MKVGFAGLGNLGRAIAERLASQGVELVLWNRTLDKAKELARQLNCEWVKKPRQLPEKADRIIVIVFDSKASEEVIFGTDGIAEGPIEDKTVLDLTTNHFEYVREAFRALKEKKAHYLDAPVLGSVVPASKGELTSLVAGEEEVFKANEALIRLYSKAVYFLGEAGKATEAKLINNVVLGGFMDLLAEALALAQKAGIGKETMLRILEDGAGRSYVLEAKKQKLLSEDFSPHFSVDLIYKDLGYALDLLAKLKSFSFSTAALRETYGLARSKGLGKLDFSVLYALFTEDLS
ncbi:MAG: NAD(P)-dependent oxidoreductase [Aquificae bacterium]|nr:NAD(P)-dependent oxidoreductase [Aquificota bacterium]